VRDFIADKPLLLVLDCLAEFTQAMNNASGEKPKGSEGQEYAETPKKKYNGRISALKPQG
jgi:hypothetical protein